jgi:hypothetical protein
MAASSRPSFIMWWSPMIGALFCFHVLAEHSTCVPHVVQATQATYDLLRFREFALHGRGCRGYPACLPARRAGFSVSLTRPSFIALNIYAPPQHLVLTTMLHEVVKGPRPPIGPGPRARRRTRRGGNARALLPRRARRTHPRPRSPSADCDDIDPYARHRHTSRCGYALIQFRSATARRTTSLPYGVKPCL